MWWEVAAGAALAGLLLYRWLTRNFDYWSKRGVAGPTPILFFGNAKDTTYRRTTYYAFFEDNYNAFPKEKIVGLVRMWHPCVLIRDLDLLQHVMIKDFDNFVDRGFGFSETGLGMNLFNVDGDSWRVLRSRLSPIFSSGKLKNIFYLIHDRGDKFIQYLGPLVKANPDQDVYQLVLRFTVATIGACAFGIDIEMAYNDTIFNKLEKIIFKSSFVIELEIMFPGILKKLNISLFPSVIKNFFYDLVDDIVKIRNGVPSTRKDFMDLLLELENAGEIHSIKKDVNDKNRSLHITKDVMAGQAFIFYAGGFETSASTVSFILHQLALNQDIQERVVREIDQVLMEHGGNLTYESLKGMPYLDQVVSETLRMYPVIDPLSRRALRDYRLPGAGVVLPAGMPVLVSVRGIHYDPKHYPEPHTFDPDRFTADNIKKRHPCAYLPFGLGPRNCVGMRFAHIQTRVCVIKLLRKYRVEPSKETRDIEFDTAKPILGSKYGIPLKIVGRN